MLMLPVPLWTLPLCSQSVLGAALTFAQQAPQREPSLLDQHVLQLLLQLIADTQAVHWGETERQQDQVTIILITLEKGE